MNYKRVIIFRILILAALSLSSLVFRLSSVNAQRPVIVDSDTLLELTEHQIDSLSFRFAHHYTINYNFLVVADSMALAPHENDIIDTCYVYRDDVIVVADIRYSRNGDIWVKVFCDQITMGWVTEDYLMKCVIPNDRISEAIYLISGSRGIWMSVLLFLGVIGFFFTMHQHRKIHVFQKQTPGVVKVYSVALLAFVVILAGFYAGIQCFAPEYWQEYYFHPTLNPLMLPGVMAVLATLVWVVLIVFVALVFVVYDYFFLIEGVDYLLEVIGICMLAYLLVSWLMILIF